jgi:tetratricopeptide (TPR) repeat protein
MQGGGYEALRSAQEGRTTFDAAAEILRAESVEHPTDAHRFEWLAIALLNARRNREALAACDAAIALDPNVARSHRVRSTVLVRLGQEEEAFNAAERAVEIGPENAQNWQRLATMCLGNDDWPRAREAADEAQRLAPDAPGAYYVRARIHIHECDWVDAQCELEAARARGAAVSGIYAFVVLQQHRIREAIAIADDVLELEPDDAYALHTAYDGAYLWMNPLARLRAVSRPAALVIVGILVALFVAGSVVLGVRIALLLSILPVLLRATFAAVEYRRLPKRVRKIWYDETRGHVLNAFAPSTPGEVTANSLVPTFRAGYLLTYALWSVAVLLAIGATIGDLFGPFLTVTATLGLAYWISWLLAIRTRRRRERFARTVALAHDAGDYDAAAREANRYYATYPNFVDAHVKQVHMLAHSDADAALVPLENLIGRQRRTESLRQELSCAADAISVTLMERGERGGALAWARRADQLRTEEDASP